MIEISVVLPQPDGPTKQRQLARRQLQVDAAQGANAGIARRRIPWSRRGSERRDRVGDGRSAWDCPQIADTVKRTRNRKRNYPRNTIAGSSTSTRRMLSRLASTMMTRTAPAVTTGTCQGMKNASARLVAICVDVAEQRRQAHADAVADDAHHQRLQQDHADDPPIADAHRLQGAELLEVLDREQVKRLPRDGRCRR